MSKFNFDCYHFNGYTGVCNLKGGECHKSCKDWISEDGYIESLAEADVKISLAKLREVLEDEFRHHLLHSRIEKIINRIKQEL